MNKHLWTTQLTPYAVDYAQWCAQQGALLRSGQMSTLDRNNLAEEIESLGRNEEDEIESRLNVLVMHLLKWQFQPERRTPSWRATIVEQRSRIARRIKKSPSLKGHPGSVLAEEYVSARLYAAGETGLAEAGFPEICPYSIEQVLDPTFYPGG